MTAKPDFDRAIEYSLEQLGARLPAYMTYHSLWHTAHDIIPAAARLARLYQVSKQDARLIEVAAAYHDLGFVDTLQNHELASARIAAQVLPDFHFTDRQIERVLGMIMATQLPQTPHNLLEEIIADADLDTLGREEDFFDRSEALRQEMAALGQPIGEQEWLIKEIHFLSSHTYFTDIAKEIRSAGKQNNIRRIEELLHRLEPPEG